MNRPTVSFVVPCYRLAHLLSECIESILSQSFEDIELLVMDDCSPDNTAEVVAKYRDSRVVYVRNEHNLGHLSNYNEGISRAKGRFVWLISADDRLRGNRSLGKHVDFLEKHPNAGYVFSPAVDLVEGKEFGILPYSLQGDQDRVWPGLEFLARLVRENFIVAPSVLVRKECYQSISYFPLNMPWGGDWYLWCVFALHHDVGYVAEPSVCYRRHGLSMTSQLTSAQLDVCAAEDIAMPWIIKREAERTGKPAIERACLFAAAHEYARSIASKRYKTSTSTMSMDEFRESVALHTSSAHERRWVMARAYARAADLLAWDRNPARARQFYRKALLHDPIAPETWAKFMLVSSGSFGVNARKALGAFRNRSAARRIA